MPRDIVSVVLQGRVEIRILDADTGLVLASVITTPPTCCRFVRSRVEDVAAVMEEVRVIVSVYPCASVCVCVF